MNERSFAGRCTSLWLGVIAVAFLVGLLGCQSHELQKGEGAGNGVALIHNYPFYDPPYIKFTEVTPGEGSETTNRMNEDDFAITREALDRALAREMPKAE